MGLDRIIFCSTSDAVYDRRMQRITTSLYENGFEVKWISRSSQNDFAIEGVSHNFIRSVISKGPLFYALFNLSLFFRLVFAKADIFCAVDLDTMLAVGMAARLRNKKYTLDAHEYFTEVPELIGRSSVKRIWTRIARKFIPHATGRYTVGPMLADALRNKYEADFSVVRNVPSLLAESSKSSSMDDKSIVYLGVLNKGRGIEQMIDAINELPAHYSLKLIGEGDLSKTLREKVRNLNLQDRVHFLGMKNPGELNALLANAWCGINLLTNESLSYYYSLANKQFDYIQAGLPSISMEFPEYVALNKEQQGSVLISELSTEKIIHAIQLLENQDFYSSLKHNCSLLRLKYNWEKEQEVLIQIYKQL